MSMAEAAVGADGTCLVCKHTLATRLNIFKTRTTFSKTLISSKLSKLVQMPFKPDSMEESSDICSNCSALINQVDECEIKLMALENEVKLKFKMPFPIEVHSRRADGQQTGQRPPSPSAAADQQLSFITIDGGALADNPTIVLEDMDVQGGNVVVYREPNYPSQQQQQQQQQQPGDVYTQSISYLDALHSPDVQQDDIGDDHHQNDDYQPPELEHVYVKKKRSPKKRKGPEMDGSGGGICELCDKSFSSDIDLRIHKATHAGERVYSCRFCDRDFPTNMALHFHMNENHPLKLQPCPYCDKRFLNRSNLSQHVNTHKEPRFNCEHCPRAFHTRADLRKHIVFRHSEAKNFPCPECDMSFKVNWLLTRHRVRVHHHAS